MRKRNCLFGCENKMTNVVSGYYELPEDSHVSLAPLKGIEDKSGGIPGGRTDPWRPPALEQIGHTGLVC